MRRLIKRLINGLLGIALFAVTGLPAAAQTPVLWGADPFANAFFAINQTTGAALITRTVSLPGFTVSGSTRWHPIHPADWSTLSPE